MTNEIEQLRKELKKLSDRVASQDKEIAKLNKRVKDVESLKPDILKYINNLMAKADQVIKNNYATLIRKSINDRQRLNTLDNEVSRISRRIK